jgi:hypothetical protein
MKRSQRRWARWSGTVWCLRRDFRDYVRTTETDGIMLYVGGQFVYTDRPTARLLARRLNECLDDTAIS